MDNNLFEDYKRIAKSVDLVEVAREIGFTPVKKGRYYSLKEIDSLRIFNRESWFRFSKIDENGIHGGTTIDFVCAFKNLNFVDAVTWLVEFSGRKCDKEINDSLSAKYKNNSSEKRELKLPEKNGDDAIVKWYLTKKRYLSPGIVNYFINNGLIYESKGYHNVVFLGKDKNGQVRQVYQRGTYDQNSKGVKLEAFGSNKDYGFNVVNTNSDVLLVFEASIDLMSYIELYEDMESNKLALGMLSDKPLITFLIDYPNIKKIKFCLDADEPGIETANKYAKKYKAHGYETEICKPEGNVKDYNEYLQWKKISGLPR